VQVYLIAAERRRLERLADQLDLTKSEVMRRGLLALEHELNDPRAHPALRLIGLAPSETAAGDSRDAARDHDSVLGDAEEASWVASPRGKRRGR
jgi:hypothetical protein